MRHQRRFLTIGDRQLHYRHAGKGAPLVMFHACPKSSIEQVPLLERLSKRFSVYAFDNPGYGDSEAVDQSQPEIDAFAIDVAAALDELGIPVCSMYGRHTGGLIALEFGKRFPGRVACAVMDGFPIFSDEERRRFLADYLQPLLPRWDGLHLPGLWARMRENYLFFPWNEGPVPAHRNHLTMPPATQLHGTAVDMLKVMDRWRVGYASAFRYRPQSALAEVDYPALIMARRDDLLYGHLERLPDLPDCITAEAHTYDVDTWAGRIEQFFLTHAVGPTAPPPPATRPIHGRSWSTMAEAGGIPIRLRRNGEGKGEVLVLHDIPGSSALEVPLLSELGQDRNVIVPDLPGIGLSGAIRGGAEGLVRIIAGLAEACLAPEFTVIARGLSAKLGIHLAARVKGVRGLNLIRPVFPTEAPEAFSNRYIAAIAPDDEGTHLTKLWYAARDNELYWPWYQRCRENIRHGERDLDPAKINAKVVAMAENMEGYTNLVHSAACVDACPGNSQKIQIPVTILHDDDPIGQSMARFAQESVMEWSDVAILPVSGVAESALLRI